MEPEKLPCFTECYNLNTWLCCEIFSLINFTLSWSEIVRAVVSFRIIFMLPLTVPWWEKKKAGRGRGGWEEKLNTSCPNAEMNSTERAPVWRFWHWSTTRKATWDKQGKMAMCGGEGDVPINSKLSSSFNFRETNSLWWTSGRPLTLLLYFIKKS